MRTKSLDKSLRFAALLRTLRRLDRHELRLADHLRRAVGVGCRLRGDAADQRLQHQEELLGKHGTILQCLLYPSAASGNSSHEVAGT